MDTELLREKLRFLSMTIAEIQAMLPEEPLDGPPLVIIKNGDKPCVPTFQMKPSRAREGFTIFTDNSGILEFPKIQQDKEVIPQRATGCKAKDLASKKLIKEILKMKTPLQNKLLRVLEKEPRYHNRTYELCGTIDGTTVYAFGKSAEDCIKSFLVNLTEKFVQAKSETKDRQKKEKEKPVLFGVFALRWYEEIHKSRVTRETYEANLGCYRNHIAPTFAKRQLNEISGGDCIRFFEDFKKKKIERTRENCDGILRQIFDYAVACELISRNPMNAMKRVKKRRVNGVPLSKAEERAFLTAIAGTKFELVFILALYTGLRPCELPSARIEGDFVVARNRKQKDVSNIVYKKIPITPMLRPFAARLAAAMSADWKELTPSHYLGDVFREFCGNHTLKDLRTTFATRAQECSVPEQVVQIWMGHSPRTLLGNTYTKFSDEYLLSEGKKVQY